MGVPLVFFLSLLIKRLRAFGPVSSPRRVALWVPAAIGDAVLAHPIAVDLAGQFQNSKIVLFLGVTNKVVAPLIAESWAVVPELAGRLEIHTLEAKKPLEALWKILNLEPVDLWLDFGQWPRMPAILTAMAKLFRKAHWTVGFATEGQCRHFAYDSLYLHRSDQHELENFRGLAGALGIKSKSFPSITTDVPNPSPVSPYVVVHMFAGGSKPHLKEPEHTQCVQWIDWLLEDRHVFLTGSSENQLKALFIQKRTKHPERVHVVAGSLSLAQTASLIRGSQFTVSVNTGILHLAAAVGARVLGLHGPTSIRRWGPVGPLGYADPRIRSLKSPLPCSPCLNLGFDYGCPVNRCMQAVRLEDIRNFTQAW